MSKTFIDMQNAIGSWMGKDTVQLPTDIRKDCLNAAQQRICEDADWSWLEKNDAVNMGAGLTSVALPADVQTLRGISYVNAAGNTINLRPFSSLVGLNNYYADVTATAGEPVAYATWGRTMYIERPVGVTTQFTVAYRGRLSDLTNDADHNILTDSHWMLLLLRALLLTSTYGFEDTRAAGWQALYQDELYKARSQDARFATSATYIDTIEPGYDGGYMAGRYGDVYSTNWGD